MKNYVKAELQIVSFVSNKALASVSLEDYLTANGRDPSDIIYSEDMNSNNSGNGSLSTGS